MFILTETLLYLEKTFTVRGNVDIQRKFIYLEKTTDFNFKLFQMDGIS